MSEETITFEQVKSFLEANSDDEAVKSYLKGLVPEEPITADKVKLYLDTPDGKALIQPMMDKRVTEASALSFEYTLTAPLCLHDF